MVCLETAESDKRESILEFNRSASVVDDLSTLLDAESTVRSLPPTVPLSYLRNFLESRYRPIPIHD